MADTEVTVALVEGDLTPILGLALANSAGNIAPEVAMRANGAFVSAGNPFPTFDSAAVAALVSLLAGQGTPKATSTVVTSQVTVGTSSVSLAAAGTMTRGWTVQNTTVNGAGYVDLCWGATAVLGHGFYRLFPGSNQENNNIIPPVGVSMSAIASVAGQTIVITVFN